MHSRRVFPILPWPSGMSPTPQANDGHVMRIEGVHDIIMIDKNFYYYSDFVLTILILILEKEKKFRNGASR